MLTLSAALMGALTTLGSTVVSVTAKQATMDAYDAVKKVIQARFGTSHPAPELIDELKSLSPQGPAAQVILEKLESFKLDMDPEIAHALEGLSWATVDARGASGTVNAQNFQGIGTNIGNATQTFNN